MAVLSAICGGKKDPFLPNMAVFAAIYGGENLQGRQRLGVYDLLALFTFSVYNSAISPERAP